MGSPAIQRYEVPRIVRGRTIRGDIRLHTGFPSAVLGNVRDLVVWLPRGYRSDSARRYPVLYLQDGQNVFDVRTSAYGVKWDFDGHVSRLVAAREMEPIIMVGIYNTPARMAEYTPPWSDNASFGRLEAYGAFLLDEVKPFIDARYRTHSERTGIVGSSLGGLSALYLGLRYPRVLPRVGCVSPSLWYGEGGMMRAVSMLATLQGPERLWLCAGTREGPRPGRGEFLTIPCLRQLRDLLLERGFRLGKSLFYHEARGGRHDEASWCARVPSILRALYPPQDQESRE